MTWIGHHSLPAIAGCCENKPAASSPFPLVILHRQQSGVKYHTALRVSMRVEANDSRQLMIKRETIDNWSDRPLVRWFHWAALVSTNNTDLYISWWGRFRVSRFGRYWKAAGTIITIPQQRIYLNQLRAWADWLSEVGPIEKASRLTVKRVVV